MLNTLRTILEERGLSPTANEQAAQEFYAAISTEDKGKIGVEMGKRAHERTCQAADGITVRSTSLAQDITTRAFCVRAESADEETRSVEAVIVTDQPVSVYDYRSGDIIDEVLRMDGMEAPGQVPMLANHSRWSLDDVFGSVRNITTGKHEAKARLFFAEDEDSTRAWAKVRDGHIQDVSAGYRVEKSVDIRPGQTAVVGGTTYKAKGRTLRISTKWSIREVSLVPIGADSRSKIRADFHPKEFVMNEKLREYLETIGLRAEATDEDAQAFYDALSDEARTRADAGEPAATADPPATPPDADNPAANDPPAGTTRSDQGGDPIDAQSVATQAVADERTRVRSLTDLAGEDVAADTLRTAIHDGTTVEEAAPMFLRDVRQNRGPNGPAIHSRSHDGDCTTRSLAAGMLIGQGLDPTECSMHNGRQTPGRRDRMTEQDADGGDTYRSMSALDICRECVRIDGGRVTHDRDDTIRAAMSGTSLDSVFSTSINARLIEAFQAEGDTTQGWVDELDVNNFQEQEDITFNGDAELDILPSGGTANHATASDSSETYRIARFAKQFVMDEQTIIDDRFGVLLTMAAEMGEAARQVRPNLVYALMLENPTLTDTGQVFNNTVVTTAGGHANLIADVMGAEGLRNGITTMATQRLNRTADQPGDPLNIRAKYLIAPYDLKWTALALLQSSELQKVFADAPDTEFANINLLAMQGIIPVFDQRLDALGVKDPKTKTVRTGSATNWFLAEGGRRGLRVAYLAGTNRSPKLRSLELSQGQWGRGWDINLDIGAAFNEWRTWVKSTGAGA